VSVTITIGIPHKALSPNARPHFMARAGVVSRARRAAFIRGTIVTVAGAPEWTNAISTVVWYTKTKRRPDADNALAMLKPTFDGLADAGVLANDRNLAHNPIRFEVDRSNPRVEVTISEVVENKEQGK
jgi:Holliday junction resolvase RusA-like endonuclease